VCNRRWWSGASWNCTTIREEPDGGNPVTQRLPVLARTGDRRSGGTCLLCPGISDVNLFRYCQGVNASTDECPLRADRAVSTVWQTLPRRPDQQTSTNLPDQSGSGETRT
jgi:hypothetical protein